MTALCVPLRGEKGLLTPQQRKPGHCSAHAEWSSFTLTLPHTYTHTYTYTYTAGQRKKGRFKEDVGTQDGHSVERLFPKSFPKQKAR